MVNYYKQLTKLIEMEKLQGKRILLDDFETMLRQHFGFGTKKTMHRWISNFQDAKIIKIVEDLDGFWLVDIS